MRASTKKQLDGGEILCLRTNGVGFLPLGEVSHVFIRRTGTLLNYCINKVHLRAGSSATFINKL